jgi:hypothetical protein
MVVLGLLLLLSVAGLVTDVVWRNTESIDAEVLGQTFSLTSGWLFAAGAGTGVIGLLGISMLVAGMRRARRRRAAVAESRNNLQGLQSERDRLAVELERERAGRTAATAGGRRAAGPGGRDGEPDVIDLGDERQAQPRLFHRRTEDSARRR